MHVEPPSSALLVFYVAVVGFSTVVGGAATADDGNGSFTQFADIVYGKKEAPWYDERRLWTDDMDSC